MTKCIDLTGKRFGKLVVIERAKGVFNHAYWKCQCDCGNIVILRKDDFIYPYSHIKSCGCWHIEESKHRPKDKINGKFIKIKEKI